MVGINVALPIKVAIHTILQQIFYVLTLSARLGDDLVLCIELKNSIHCNFSSLFLPIGL